MWRILFTLCIAFASPPTNASDDSSRSEVVRIDPEAPFLERLNDYRFFKDNASQTPSQGVIPYELNTPHFADYANLRRFLWVPPGNRIQFQPPHSLLYPVGSVLILTLGYPHDQRDHEKGERLLETRLLVKSQEGWKAAQYVWNDHATEAYLTIIGTDRSVDWVHWDGSRRSLSYHVPNINQCKMCHEIGEEFRPLGPGDLRNLNRPIGLAGESRNQLEWWTENGLLEGLPVDPIDLAALPVWNDPTTGSLDQRARAYLEMNCSSCHRPGGLAITSGLDLTFDQTEPVRYGIFKSPVAAGRGVGKARFGIFPGRPEDSILYHRLGSTDPGVRMPVVGRSLVHEEGLALIGDWIESMEEGELVRAHEERERISKNRWGAPSPD